MFKKITPAILIFFMSTGAIFAQSPGQALFMPTIDSLLKQVVDNQLVPGGVIAIRKDKQVLYRKAFGFVERKTYDNKPVSNPAAMTTDHLFDIASLTKVVATTTSVMLLVDRGLLKIDDPAGKYIAAFDADDKKKITIRHLLNHTAGLITWYPLYYRASNKKEVYRLIGELPLAYPVGEARHYSDLGFILLGEIIEKISGMPLERFVQENIFNPLKMDHTTYNPLSKEKFTMIAPTSHGNPYEKRMVYDTALGFVYKEIDPQGWNGWRNHTLRGEVNDGNAWYAMNGVSGHAGLFSTVDDLQKLVNMLLDSGMVNGKLFVSQKTIQLFLTPDEFKNGLGWMMDNGDSFLWNAPVGSFGHTGFTGTSIVVIPSMKLSLILLINRQNMGLLPTRYYYNPNPLRKAVLTALLNATR